MVKTKIKFKSTKAMPSYNGYPDGQILDVEESGVKSLMKDYPDNFEFVTKAVPEPPSNKMIELTDDEKEQGYKFNFNGDVVNKKGKLVRKNK